MMKRYLFYSVAQIFLPFFIVLFFIASVVLLIGLATVTQFVKLNIWDLQNATNGVKYNRRSYKSGE